MAGVLVITFFSWQWRRAHWESSQDKAILAAARKHGVDPALIKAVVWRESKFDPDARGGKGELGLMQIMPTTGQEWSKASALLSSPTGCCSTPQRTSIAARGIRALARYTQTDDSTMRSPTTTPGVAMLSG